MANSSLRHGGADGLRFGFISYVSRSGSTLLSRLLNQHPAICVCTEAHLPKELFSIGPYGGLAFSTAEDLRGYLARIAAYSKLESWRIDLERVVEIGQRQGWPVSGEQLLRHMLRVHRDKHSPASRLVLYKGPPAMPWDMPSVLRAFPGFACLHLVRDPRAVYASQKRSINPYSGRPFASDSLDTARQWRSAMLASRKVADVHCREIRYEDLVATPEKVLRELCQFLGVAFDPSYFQEVSDDFSSRLPEAEGQLHSRIDAPPDRSRIEAWKTSLDRREIRQLEAVLREEMRERGYESLLPQYRLHRFTGLLRIRMRLAGRWLGRAFSTLTRLMWGDRRVLDKIRGLVRAGREG